jgi:hypothetical protein
MQTSLDYRHLNSGIRTRGLANDGVLACQHDSSRSRLSAFFRADGLPHLSKGLLQGGQQFYLFVDFSVLILIGIDAHVFPFFSITIVFG